jgi:hypothetical protein
MAERAQITSVEAIESFRSKLIEYISQMRPTLGEVSSEVVRMRVWLQGEHRIYWEGELRRRARRLEEAKQELFNATMANLNEAAALHRMAVQRAQRAVQEAETKLLVLKKWSREIENRAAPLMKQVDQLYGFLAVDMARGVAHLDNVLKALEAYRNVTPTHRDAPATASPTGVEPVAPEQAKTEETK